MSTPERIDYLTKERCGLIEIAMMVGRSVSITRRIQARSKVEKNKAAKQQTTRQRSGALKEELSVISILVDGPSTTKEIAISLYKNQVSTLQILMRLEIQGIVNHCPYHSPLYPTINDDKLWALKNHQLWGSTHDKKNTY